MVLISKSDKRIWKNYVSNFEKYAVIPKNNSVSSAKITFDNKNTNKKDMRSNYRKSIRKKKVKPDVLLDLHGHTLYSAKIVLNKEISYIRHQLIQPRKKVPSITKKVTIADHQKD